MEFLSIPFSCTLILAFILYYIKENKDWQRFVLLATSVVFVGFYHWQYLVSAIGITLLTFYMGKWIHKSLGTKKGSLSTYFGYFYACRNMALRSLLYRLISTWHFFLYLSSHLLPYRNLLGGRA